MNRIDVSPVRIEILLFVQTLLPRQARYFCHWSYFDGTDACPRNPCGDADRFVEILGIDEEVPTQLLACFCERAIGHGRFAVANSNTGGLETRMQRSGS